MGKMEMIRFSFFLFSSFFLVLGVRFLALGACVPAFPVSLAGERWVKVRW